MSFEDKRRRDLLNPNLGLKCIKYMLCAINFLFVLTGIMIISIGSAIFTMYDDFSHFLDPRYFSPALLLVIIGTVIFIISFLGFCGALKESTCMVLVFAVSLFLILFLEFSAAIASYAYRNKIISVINTKMNNTMHLYEKNLEAKEAIDFLQRNLLCCGYHGPQDWNGILTNSKNPNGVPDSCCDDGPFETGNSMSMLDFEEKSTSCKETYVHGCFSDLAYLVNRSALYVITGAVMIALLQFSGIIFACVLGHSIRYHKTRREMFKWQQRGPLSSEPDNPLRNNELADSYVFM